MSFFFFRYNKLKLSFDSGNKRNYKCRVLKKNKKTSIIINTGRGPLINEKDAAEALKEKRLAGLACDVLSVEPPAKDNPLLKAPNCIITPHIAWQTFEARERLIKTAAANVKAFIAGKEINRVN